MMKKSKAGFFAVLAIGLVMIFAMVDHEPVQASETSAAINHYLVEQQANLNELYQVRKQLVELGEEDSDLYLAVLNAIDTSQQLVDEAVYWQSAELQPASEQKL
ncbi:hypothetical protein MD588_00115 [Photobacterium sp. SDRW27]|uniref:hypothetical protein n=1 Tax=Photobacterium obscurum TaxID=2829490 RepID=UPI00224479C9|nr:hypothetical protein [Photobacterium obscurum]MCW8327204.1 hypothetical protein [Photobacterium obscurum]